MNKKVLIIGGTSGIGISIATLMAKNNYDILLTYFNNYDKAVDIKNEIISKYNVNVDIFYLDIRNESSINEFYNRVSQKYKDIDVLINSACLCRDNYYMDKTKNEFMEVLEVNLVGPFLVIQRFCDMIKDIIINIASTDGIDTYNPYSIDYSASKAGLINMSSNLALVLNSRVISLALNYVDTDSVLKMDENFLKSELKRIGQERLIKKEDVALEVLRIIQSKNILSGSIVRMDE